MGTLDLTRVYSIANDINADIKNYPVFIETGTFEGQTCINLHSTFETLYTIEIDKRYFDKSQFNFKNKNIKNVNLLFGDSISQLSSLLNKINTNIFVWLDGHVSGDAGQGLGEKSVPLLEECNAIQSYCKNNNKKAIVVIDDYRLFGTRNDGGGWSSISKETILDQFKDNFIENSVHIKDDALFLHVGKF